MKAIVATKQGGPEVLETRNLPDPTPGANQVLIRVHAFSINPVDYKIREHGFGMQFPIVLGLDVSGTVEATGSAAGAFKTGDPVIAKLPFNRQGGYAELVVAEVELTVLKPDSLSFEEAAAIPLASLTALQALFDHGGLQKGQKVLIHAASGGVGLFAVQFALLEGAYVIATASEKNHSRLRELGVQELIDYKSEKFYDKLKDLDLVFDAIGNEESINHSADVLRQGGKVVSITEMAKSPRIERGEVRAEHFMTIDNPGQLAYAIDLAGTRKLKVFIDQVLPFSEVVKAQKIQAEGHVSGKLVVSII